jgi:hypothetical protein
MQMGNRLFDDPRAPVLFLHSYASLPSESIPFESEHLDWYRPSEITDLQANMRFDFKTQINELFRRVSPSSVALGDVLQYLQRNELNLFRAATDADNNQMPLAQMHPKDQIKGFWAVITKRTNSRSLSSLYRAVGLFNHVLAGILSGTKGEAWAVIKTAEEFAPTMVSAAEELLYRLEAKSDRDTIRSEEEVDIQDLRENLECLRHVIRRSDWSLSADHLERFLSLADLVRDSLVRKNEADLGCSI